MLLLGQATPHSAVWVISTEPFACLTIEPPLSPVLLQGMKAFLWAPPGAGEPDFAVVRSMVELYSREVEHTAMPTTYDVVQGSTDPAHTPPPWLVCDSPHDVTPRWHGLVHTSEPLAVVEHAFGDYSGPRSTLALHFPPDFPGAELLAGCTVFEAFHVQLAQMPPPPSGNP